jgi:RHS repeat-associated protein
MRNPVTVKPMDRAIAALWIFLISTLGCPGGGVKVAPAPGLPQYQERAMIPVPGAAVNPMGGNLLVRRAVLDIDTHFGSREIGATYNSASGEWLWSFDISYHGASFVDPTGASHDTSTLAPGDAIPGTVWVVVDSDTVKTKGGLAHDFAPDSRLGAVHYTSAEYPRLTYRSEMVAGEPRTVAVDQCMAPGDCNSVFEISYGAEGRVASITDRAGRMAEIEYSDDRLVRVRDGLDTARGWPGTRYEYADTRLTAIVSSEGERVEYGYSGRRLREVRAIGEENPVHRFNYYVKNDAGLFATRYLDPLGNLFWLRYDSRRRLHEFEAVDVEELLRFTWDGSRVAAEIQPSGVTTRWTHRDDDVAVEVQPSGNVVLWSYAADAVNRDAPLERAPLEVVDDIGLRERRSYDAAGRLVAVENGEGEVVASYSYASDQTVASVTTADGAIGYADYGAHGHPTRITSAGLGTTNEYDPVGNLRQGWNGVAPELGGIVYREYDEDRNLCRIAVADAGLGGIQLSPDQFIDIDYRSDGRRTRIARPGGGDHEFVYDALGRLTRISERVDGVWRATTYEYDAAGRSAATERANGMRRETDRDALGRLVSIRNLVGGVIESTAILSYAGGQLRSIEDSVRGGVESYWYDGAGRVEAIAYPEGEVLLWDYDLRSRKIREGFATDSTVRWIDRGYDLANREVGVWDSGEPLLQHGYEDGKRIETSYGNGLTRTYHYDSATGQLDESRTDGPDGIVEKTWITRERLASFVPGLRVTAVTRTYRGVVTSTTEDYLLGPAASASGQDPPVGKRVYMWSDGSGGSLYEYDALGNARGSDSTGESLEYNAEGNRLLSATTNAAGTIEYSYDEAGFATSRGGVPLTWTASGRLASFGADVILEWDALDRRVRSTVMGAEAHWLFGGRVQASPEGLPASVDLGEVRVDLAGDRHLYRHHDFRGNVKLVSDQEGEIRSHYQYDAYGLRQVHGAEDDSVRFAGRSQIGELVAMDARIYDPAVGRFLSPDPVLQHVNQYAYVLGNPVWFTDPSGRDAESVIEGMVVTIALGAAMASLFVLSSVVALLLAATSLTVAALGFAFFVARQGTPSRRRGSGAVFGPSSRGAPGRTGGVGGSDGSCSPVRLASVPGLGILHWILIGAQILLAPLLIRSWAGRRRRRRR